MTYSEGGYAPLPIPPPEDIARAKPALEAARLKGGGKEEAERTVFFGMLVEVSAARGLARPLAA